MANYTNRISSTNSAILICDYCVTVSAYNYPDIFFIQWVWTRTRPPLGVMPSVIIRSIIGPYSATLHKTGLPDRTQWSVKLGGEAASSRNSTVLFKLANGTYNYSVPGVMGLRSYSPKGIILVNGGRVDISVSFRTWENFTFMEQGLPHGSYSSVFIDGSYHNATSEFFQVRLNNGTYFYAVILPRGYSTPVPEGKVGWNHSAVLIEAT